MSDAENEHGRRDRQWPPRLKATRAERWNLASGDDLEAALRAAERLLTEAYDGRRHDHSLRLAMGSLAIVTIGSLVGVLLAVFEFSSGLASITATVTGLVTGVATLGLLVRLAVPRRWNRWSHEVRLELAIDLSSLVRDVLVEVAEREHWSFLRIESTKLRLAAFPLRTPKRAYPSDDAGDSGSGE